MGRTRRAIVLAVCLLGLAGRPAPAQSGGARTFDWEIAGLAAAGILSLVAIDEPVRRFLQARRTSGLDAVAGGARRFGEWPLFTGLPVALTLAGALTSDPGLTRTAQETARAAIVTMGVVTLLKRGLGRSRPWCGCGPVEFAPLGAGRSLPSGHTAMAFAIATSLADRTPSRWAGAGYYTAASLVAWSRLNDNRHWLSDVVAGALVGTISARLATGRFGAGRASRPNIAVGTSGASVGWFLAF